MKSQDFNEHMEKVGGESGKALPGFDSRMEPHEQQSYTGMRLRALAAGNIRLNTYWIKL